MQSGAVGVSPGPLLLPTSPKRQAGLFGRFKNYFKNSFIDVCFNVSRNSPVSSLHFSDFSKFTERCNRHHQLVLDTLITPARCLLPFYSPCSSPEPQTTTDLFSVSLNLPFLNILYKQNHTVCGLRCLVPFAVHHVSEVRPRSGVC